MGNSLEKEAEFHITVLGASKVGKTALISRLVSNSATRNSYAVYLYSENKTVHLRVDDSDKVIEVHECDFEASSDSPNALRNYTPAGYLLVYDATNPKSFKDVQLIRVENAPIVLAALKSDAEDRVVSNDEGEQFAKEQGWHFFAVSAKDNLHVDEVFQQVAREVVAGTSRKETKSK